MTRLTGVTPHRFYQKIHRNDHTDVARWSLFYRPALARYACLARDWELVTRKCYLFRYIHADKCSAAKPTDEVEGFKQGPQISLDDYLASMQADVNDAHPAMQYLGSMLTDVNLIEKTSKIHEQH